LARKDRTWIQEDTVLQSETTVRQNMGRMLWWLATEVMVKILGDANSRPRDGFEKVTIGEERSCLDSGGYRVTTVRQNMGRTLLWLVTEVNRDGENPQRH
jgi:hypothetical protein